MSIDAEQFIDDLCYKNHILQRIGIEVTYRCNERCKHCYVFDEKKDAGGELSLEQYLKLFDDLRKMETIHITFTGGDPSQRKDFTEILRGAIDREFAVSIFTNGIGYSEETLDEIIALHPYSISLSVYSGIPEEHDYITNVKGSFQRTLATLKKVKDAGIAVNVKTPVMNQTLKGFPVVHALCKELDISHQVSYFICATNKGDISPLKFRLGDVEKYKKIKRLALEGKELGEFLPRDIHGEICGAGRIALSVNPYGEVFPCNGFNYRLGNIKETPINEIWNCDALKRIYDLRFDQLGDSCVNCLYRNDCLYCLGSALSENGNMFSPVKENCLVARAEYEVRTEQ